MKRRILQVLVPLAALALAAFVGEGPWPPRTF
jgi:hypothetical protein